MKLTGSLKRHSPHPIRPHSEPGGQGLVELVLVIPILIFIIVGALDVGRVFFSVITVTNVAREGVRYLTLHPDDRLYDYEDAECLDLVESLQPDPDNKDAYFCTYQAAMQEAETSSAPILVDPAEISLDAGCPDNDPINIGCDRASMAWVTATYIFHPVTLLVLPEVFEEGFVIERTVEMLVP